MMTRKFTRAAFILLLSGLATVALAHHNGNLYFDGEKTIEFENATVVSMVMVNPHARLEFTIENENGEVEEWSAETQSQNALRRKGIHAGPGQGWRCRNSDRQPESERGLRT